MGEAKRRKNNDPFYGHLPKLGKGIVISSPVVIGENGSFEGKGGIDDVELRRAVLFWDRLVKPTNNMIYIAPSPDELFLKECGLLSELRMHLDGMSGQIGSLYAHCHLTAFSQLEIDEPGIWSMSEGENSFNLKAQNGFKQGRGALVQLHRAVPLPTGDVPLNDLLEFKLKRRDEIISLTLEIDSLFARINNASDADFELQRAVSEIDQKCADVVKVGRESNIKFALSDFTCGISLELSSTNLLSGGALGAIMGSAFGMPQVGAALGSAASILKIQVGLGGNLKRSSRNDKLALSPYRVVSRLINEPI